MSAESDKPFFIEKAKTGRANCKKCKEKCENGQLRIAKLVANYFSDSDGFMKQWYHVNCLFESFKTQKATTKRIDSVEEIGGWESLLEEERDEILEKLQSSINVLPSPSKPKKMKQSTLVSGDKDKPQNESSSKIDIMSSFQKDSSDNLFSTFRKVCDSIADENGYNMKSEILNKFLVQGTNGKKFEGDLYLWLKLLLPMAVKRIYNLQSKQLVKLFSKIYRINEKDMLVDLEQGDVSETIRKYFELSSTIKPKMNNELTMQEVDEFLNKLSKLTKQDDQFELFSNFCKNIHSDDLKTVIRLIKCDLKINAGPRHILDAIGNDAYSAFQLSRDLKMVVERFASTLLSQNAINNNLFNKNDSKQTTIKDKTAGGVKLMYPISPMLAEACKSVEKAITKNPEGVYSEIKYDGERVQIHKKGSEFRFFTRNLKPVLDHKISRCKDYIPKAFPSGQDMILDSEIIVVNTLTGELLPFGTLGVHKREQFVNSEVCLFIFDCLYYNGEDLTKRPLKERKKILEKEINPVKNHVQLSEYYLIKTQKELTAMTAKVLKSGLEGLVLKNIKSLYQPGKRGWLKIKKDYLFEGRMADTADLVVLGAWFGTGRKGGMLSIFLMGAYDPKSKIWKTVTKVHSGLDDNEMDNLQNDFKKLMKRVTSDKIPSWLNCKKQLIPHFLAEDPDKMPVWEITGAEFTKSDVHTAADGLSIRFPRITRIRDDKTSKEATNTEELKILYTNSKDHMNIDLLTKGEQNDSEDDIKIKTKLFDDKDDMEEEIDEQTSKLNAKRKSDTLIESPKNKKIKQELNESDDKCEANAEDYAKNNIKEEKFAINKREGIFSNIIVFMETEERFSHFKEILAEFHEHGGTVTKDRKVANYILHSDNHIKEDPKKIRKKFSPESKHLTYKWLVDCIKAETVITKLHDYAVKI